MCDVVDVARAVLRALASQAILPTSSMRPGRLLSVSTTAESIAVGYPVPTLPFGAAGRSALLAGVVRVHEWTSRDSSIPIAVSCLDQACYLALAYLCSRQFGRAFVA